MGIDRDGHLLYHTDSSFFVGTYGHGGFHIVSRLLAFPSYGVFYDYHSLRLAQAQEKWLKKIGIEKRMSSNCCSVSETTPEETVLCPRCGENGNTVSLLTVGAMAKTQVEAAKLSAREYKLCRNRDCPVVYYAGEIQIEKSDLRVAINFKEREYEGPVCYCFNHTVASITAEVQSRGHSTVQEMITHEIKAGRCACEVKNPAGICCLGDITRAVQVIQKAQPQSART